MADKLRDLWNRVLEGEDIPAEEMYAIVERLRTDRAADTSKQKAGSSGGGGSKKKKITTEEAQNVMDQLL